MDISTAWSSGCLLPLNTFREVFFDIEIEIGGALTPEYIRKAPKPITSIAWWDKQIDIWKIGIVDKLGGLQTAIDLAKLRLGISKETKAYIQTWPKKEDGIKSLLRQFGIDKSDDESSGKANIAKLLGLDPLSLANTWNAIPPMVQAQIKYSASLLEVSQREKVMVALPNLLDIR